MKSVYHEPAERFAIRWFDKGTPMFNRVVSAFEAGAEHAEKFKAPGDQSEGLHRAPSIDDRDSVSAVRGSLPLAQTKDGEE